ncbi:hypothetical protein CQA53_06315 [Helicobacter didelphidarum]|uniref:Outer membrane protein beta-barrel domain-containing protein n=1 Tax=Helicobacter didelphidarum TaxID=2040648 RepID=A0A3D8IL75_9HELI|nr:hypothetical protein [Helicobacter didelphidarum]RDU65384.1 hypothetical protein CQA53_06315 [Helicobacter didelphidarum]
MKKILACIILSFVFADSAYAFLGRFFESSRKSSNRSNGGGYAPLKKWDGFLGVSVGYFFGGDYVIYQQNDYLAEPKTSDYVGSSAFRGVKSHGVMVEFSGGGGTSINDYFSWRFSTPVMVASIIKPNHMYSYYLGTNITFDLIWNVVEINGYSFHFYIGAGAELLLTFGNSVKPALLSLSSRAGMMFGIDEHNRIDIFVTIPIVTMEGIISRTEFEYNHERTYDDTAYYTPMRLMIGYKYMF